MESTAKKFTTRVQIQVLDAQGNLIEEVDDSNAETVWAKANTPVAGTLYLDMVTTPFEEFFGLPLSAINKTCFEKTDTIRSNILNSAFSHNATTKTYSIDFNWTNTSADTLVCNGFITYNSTDNNIYTIFDLSVKPINISPGSVIIGKYNITYDNATPSISADSSAYSTISNTNTTIYDLKDPISPDIRKYKFTRAFTKTSEYSGVNATDTNFSSSLTVDVVSSRTDNRAVSDFACSEIFYKCLVSGQPSGAVVCRHLKYDVYRSTGNNFSVKSNVNYFIAQTPVQDYLSNPSDIRTLFPHYTIYCDTDFETIPILPWKVTFPSTVDLNNWGQSNTRSDYQCETYTNLILSPVSANQLQWVSYLYWSDSPICEFYISGHASMLIAEAPVCYIYVNGTQYSSAPEQLTTSGSDHYKYTFDLSGEVAGEGVVILTVKDIDYLIRDNAVTYYYIPKFCLAGGFHGYVVNYAGLLTPGSGAVNVNWISTGFANKSGTDQTILDTPVVDAATANAVSTVTDTLVSYAMENCPFQYNVWVKLSEKDKVVGDIETDNAGTLISYPYRYTTTHTGGHVCAPFYVTDNNFQHIGSLMNCTSGTNVPQYIENAAYYEHTYNLAINNHITSDVSNREITYIDDAVFRYPNHNTFKVYVSRPQGTINYTTFIPETLAGYVEGNATVLHGAQAFSFETTLAQDEYIKYATVSFDALSTFASGEYLSIGFNDADNAILVDALEEWRYYAVSNIPTTNIDSTSNEYLGADQVVVDTDTSAVSLLRHSNQISTINVTTLSPDLQIASDHEYTHRLSYSVPICSDEVIILLPKTIEENGETLLTNIESVYITDNMHVIPWVLNPVGVNSTTDADVEEAALHWVITLNKTTIEQLYSSEKTSLMIHAYVAAKTQSAWLPMHVKTRHTKQYSTPQELLNEYCIVYVESDTYDGDVEFIDASPIYTKNNTHTPIGEVHHSTAYPNINASSIYYNGNATLRLNGIAKDYGAYDSWTISMNVYPLLVTGSDRYIFDCTGTNGISVKIDTNGYLYTAMNHSNKSLLSIQKIKQDEWNHIALVFEKGTYSFYLNGVMQGSRADSIDNNSSYSVYLQSSSKNLGSSSFIGCIDEFVIFSRVIWDTNFTPPTKSWKKMSAAELLTSHKDSVLSCVFPVCFDNKIKITKANTGEAVKFAHLDCMGLDLITGHGNKIYIQHTQSTADTNPLLIDYMTVPMYGSQEIDSHHILKYYGVFQHLLTEYSNRVVRDSHARGSDYLRVGDFNIGANHAYSGGKTLAYTDKFNELHYEYSRTAVFENFTDTYIIESDVQVNATAPEDFFTKYITTGNIHAQAAFVRNMLTTKYLIYNDPGQTSNYSGASFYMDELLLNDNLSIEVFATDAHLEMCTTDGSEQTYFTSVPNIYEMPHSLRDRLNRKFSWRHMRVDTEYFSPDTQYVNTDGSYLPARGFDIWRTGNNHITMQYINTTVMIVHKDPIFVDYTYKCLDVCSYEDKAEHAYTGAKSIPYKSYASHTHIEKLTTPTQYLYMTNKSLFKGDTAAYLIDNKDLVNANFDIKTYVTDNFICSRECYNNITGSFPLSALDSDITYYLIVSDRFMDSDDSEVLYAYTKNTELANMLASGLWSIGEHKIGWLSDTLSEVENVPAGTTLTGTPTNTIALMARRFGFRSAVAPTNTGWYTTYYSLYEYGHAERIDHKTFDFSTHTTVVHDPNVKYQAVMDRTRMINNIFHIYTAYPYFTNFNIDTLFANKKHGAHEWTQSDDIDIIPNNGIHYYSLDNSTPVFESGTLPCKALYVDSRIVARTNIQHNLVFDSNALPVDDINSLGLFTPNMYTDEYGEDALTIVPVVKITNTNDGTYTIYAIDNQYSAPTDVTAFITNVQVDNISTYFLDHIVKNVFTFEHFNPLLTTYTGPEYTLSIGVFLYMPELLRLVSLKSLSAHIEFNNTAHYVHPKWCYVNEKADMVSENITNITSDTAQYNAKIYNPNDTMVTDTVVRIDTSAYDFTGFANGIVALNASGVALPTVFETGTDGTASSDIMAFNGNGIYVKIDTIAAKATANITFTNQINISNISDVFDFYESFASLDTAIWDFSWADDASATGGDVDSGIGAESTSDRVVAIRHTRPIDNLNNTLQLYGEYTTALKTKSTTMSNALEYTMQFRADNEAILQIGLGDTSKFTTGEKLVPYYHTPPDVPPETFVRTDIHKGSNHLYVYYGSATATDASSGHDAFFWYDDFSNTALPGWEIRGDAPTLSNNTMYVPNHGMVYSTNRFYGSFGNICKAKLDGGYSLITGFGTGGASVAHTNYDTAATYIYLGYGSLGYGQDLPRDGWIYHNYQIQTDDMSIFSIYDITQQVQQMSDDTPTDTVKLGSAFQRPNRYVFGGYTIHDNTPYGRATHDIHAHYKIPDKRIHSYNWQPEETGSWVVDGHTFTKRKLCVVKCNATNRDVTILLDSANWTSNEIRITTMTNFAGLIDVDVFGINKQQYSNYITGGVDTTHVLPYWYAAEASICAEHIVRSPMLAVGANEIYVYFTSETADNYSNPKDVFDVYDNFKSSELDTNIWNIKYPAGLTLVNSQLYITSSTSQIRSHKLYADDRAECMFSRIGNSGYYYNTGVGFMYSNNNSVSTYHNYISMSRTRATYTIGNYSTTKSLIGLELGFAKAYQDHTVTGYQSRLEDGFSSMSASSLGDTNTGYPQNLGTFGGHFVVSYLPGSSGAFDIAVTEAAAWKRAKEEFSLMWDDIETGSWEVDGHTFTNRVKLTVHSESVDKDVRIKVPSYAFGNTTNVRYVQTVRTGETLRTMDSNYSKCKLKFHPLDNDVSYSITPDRDEWVYTSYGNNLPVRTPATGSLAIQASTGDSSRNVVIDWIRASKYVEKELIHLLEEDVDILVENVNSDWYLFDTAGTSSGDATLATSFDEVFANNRNSLFYEKWKPFPNQTKINTSLHGSSRLLNYRK